MRTVTEAVPPTTPRVPIPLPAPTGTAEKRLTLLDRAQHTPINTATRRPMPKAQGPRLAKTPMVAVRHIQPAREHRQQAPTVAAHIMPKDPGRQPARVQTAAPRPTTRASAPLEPLLPAQRCMPVIITTVGQLRFTIRRSLSTPTLQAVTTAEAGPRPGQQLQAPLLAQWLERPSLRRIITQPTPMLTRLAWQRERQLRRRMPPLLLPMPTTLAWRLAQRALLIQWEKSSRRHQPVAQRPP